MIRVWVYCSIPPNNFSLIIVYPRYLHHMFQLPYFLAAVDSDIASAESRMLLVKISRIFYLRAVV